MPRAARAPERTGKGGGKNAFFEKKGKYARGRNKKGAPEKTEGVKGEDKVIKPLAKFNADHHSRRAKRGSKKSTQKQGPQEASGQRNMGPQAGLGRALKKRI